MIDSFGRVAFRGSLGGAGIDISNRTATWSEQADGLHLVAQLGAPPVGTGPGSRYTWFESPTVNRAGQLVFQGGFSGTESNPGGNGIWSNGRGDLRLVVRSGEAAPGTELQSVFASFFTPSISDGGAVAFLGNLSGPAISDTNRSGLWSDRNGSMSLVARSGEQAAGLSPGVGYSLPWIGLRPRINAQGGIAFRAETSGSPQSGIWSDASGVSSLVLAGGTPVPGDPSGTVFHKFETQPSINNTGRIAFQAFERTPPSSAVRPSIWYYHDGMLEPIARPGDVAPGMPAGTVFGSGFAVPAINSSGKIAFRATVAGSGISQSNSSGLWTHDDGVLSLIFRDGDRAPGTPDGVVFSSPGNARARPTLNRAGQVAFAARLAGVGIDDSNNFGIWATELDGTLQLIARTGETIEVAPGDFRTITTLQSAIDFVDAGGGDDGLSTGLNDAGHLAFAATFLDGSSGVFVQFVPEPGTFCLLAIFVAASRRRHRRSVSS